MGVYDSDAESVRVRCTLTQIHTNTHQNNPNHTHARPTHPKIHTALARTLYHILPRSHAPLSPRNTSTNTMPNTLFVRMSRPSPPVIRARASSPHVTDPPGTRAPRRPKVDGPEPRAGSRGPGRDSRRPGGRGSGRRPGRSSRSPARSPPAAARSVRTRLRAAAPQGAAERAHVGKFAPTYCREGGGRGGASVGWRSEPTEGVCSRRRRLRVLSAKVGSQRRPWWQPLWCRCPQFEQAGGMESEEALKVRECRVTGVD